MNFVSPIIGPIVQILMVPMKKQLGYLFSSTKHVRNMKARMEQLDGISHDVKRRMEKNKMSNMEFPTGVPGWLTDVENTKKDAGSISSTGCFNIKMRFRAGRKAFKTTEDIDRLIKTNSEMIWDDAKKFPAEENSNNASTSAPAYEDAQNHFKSNEKPFNDALAFLQPDHKSQVIALHGMGGVGKSTMMERLKKTLEDRKTYELFMKVVIGETGELFNIQRSLAEYISRPLTEMDPTIRAKLLGIAFTNLQEGKRKVLVILDDVWKTIKLDDIGLNPLPKGFKLLLTSRNKDICRQIAAKANFDFKLVEVELMKEPEAQNLFWQIAGDANKKDKELNRIGTEIVRECGFLPLAINIVASRLQFEEKESIWKDTLRRLKNNVLEEKVQESIKISYDHIKDGEEKAMFLLCGLFHDDFNIPIEELTRYAWGLQLFNGVYTLVEARNMTETCVHRLRIANLLMDSDYLGCVKMHDLVLDFVLGIVSKGDHPWFINHGDISKWSKAERRESCKRISITCAGMSEFPTDFGNPNVSLLRLMDGDKSLKFPANFYERMENLEVIVYENMKYPLLPKSLHCFPKLRTLILHRCLLMFDCSAIGELLHLEVLSFAHCGIRKLPAEIGKLKELKLLDLTGCVDLRIDDGVLKILVKLEELYMKTVGGKAIRFTDGNREEFAECSKHLSALEVEFFDNNHIPENMLFTKLERFRISMGRSLKDNEGKNMHSFENTLMLVTNQAELWDLGLNELFQKTEVLYLEVDGMNDLEAVQFPQHSFNKLRVLDVFNCANLKNLFTVPMANGLMKLERLTVSQCPDLEVLVYGEKSGDGVIKFQGLKFLSLKKLPKLVGLCNTINVIELPELMELRLDGLPNFTSIYPDNTSVSSSMSSNISAIQPFFNKEVSIPKLKILKIVSMNKLKNIWPHQVSSSDEVNACMLREIEVKGCDDIVNLFPINPMWLLHHLEELTVSQCGGIEVLFNVDMSCVGEIEEYSSNLRRIYVFRLGTLRELWRVKGVSSSGILMRSFRAVERIRINECECFVNVFTPSVTKSDVRTLMNVSIDGRRLWGESGINIQLVQKSQEIDVISKGEISEDEGFISAIPMTLNRLQVWGSCKDVEVVFEMESSSSSSSSTDLTTTRHNHHQPLLLLPHLKVLRLFYMERMSHAWKCNWNKLVIPQNQSLSSFHNLTSIHMEYCNSIKYLFSPLMGKLLPNLKVVRIYRCDGMEEVVSDRDIDDNDEMVTSVSTTLTNTISFPHLERLHLEGLRSLKSIDGGNARGRSSAITTTSNHDHFKVGVASWFLSQYTKKMEIVACHALSRVFPSDVAGQPNKLEELRIANCKSMVEVFEREEGNSDGVESSNKVGDGSDDTCTTMTIPRSANMTLLQLPNLTIMNIEKCERLEYIFTTSTLGSLRQLKELTVKGCKAMQVIVKEDGEHTAEASKTIVFPRLLSLTLVDLRNVKGFFLGINEFRWPLLEKVKMYGCPQMMSLTSGRSVAQKLKYIHTGVGKHSLEECGLNFHLTNETQETRLPMSSTPDMTKLLQLPCSFSNLVEVDAQRYDKLLYSRIIFPCNALLKLENLEKLCITNTWKSTIEEVFEVEEGTNDDVNLETQSVVIFHKLKEVTLDELPKLRHMWKSNPRIVLNFPNLTKVSINECPLLGHVFTCGMVGSLLQLQELQISDCENMDVIVKQVEDSETRPTEVEFPCLKSIKLYKLPNLKGFCLGKEAFVWQSLDTLEIKKCPQIEVFTNGQSTTPELKLIDTTFGLCHATEDPNSFIKTKQQEGWEF